MPDLQPQQQPTLNEILQEVRDLRREVQGIKRRLFMASLYGTVKLLVIVCALAYGVWLLQPQIDLFKKSWTQIESNLKMLEAVPQAPAIDQRLLDQLQRQYAPK